MKKYELTVMFATSENEVESEKRTSDLIKKMGLKILKLDKWGVKSLAYPIDKQTKAHYLFYILEGEGEGIGKLDKELALDEKMLRYLIVKSLLEFKK
jgi:small subunit ribosomal protein S6